MCASCKLEHDSRDLYYKYTATQYLTALSSSNHSKEQVCLTHWNISVHVYI